MDFSNNSNKFAHKRIIYNEANLFKIINSKLFVVIYPLDAVLLFKLIIYLLKIWNLLDMVKLRLALIL